MSQKNIGRFIGKYKIVEHLGSGGMAEVYKAYQASLDRYVALKLMHPSLAEDESFSSRFGREARSLAAINHPHIISVYDFDVEGNTSYIVMEYISGGTLKELQTTLTQRGERLPLAQAVKLTLQVADALAYAHGRGLIHRDIKPANVMINERGDAILTDFGIAKMMTGPSYTMTGAMIGTPAYMSPEQAMGQPGDERSDLYALGVLFFELVAGKLPFEADTPMAVVIKHISDPVPYPREFNATLPPAIEHIIRQTLAKDPADRFPSVHAFARALRETVNDSSLGLELAGVVPAALLQDRPTPLPDVSTIVSFANDATQVASTQVASTQAAATLLAPSEVASAPAGQQSGGGGKRRLGVAAGVVGLLLLFAGGVFAFREPLGL